MDLGVVTDTSVRPRLSSGSKDPSGHRTTLANLGGGPLQTPGRMQRLSNWLAGVGEEAVAEVRALKA